MEQKLLIFGHRGDGSSNNLSPELQAIWKAGKQRMPENTMAAFYTALSEGADGIELDVMLSADNMPMVIHDDALNLHVEGARRNDKNLGRVSQKDANALQEFDVGQGCAIPRLSEVLELMMDFPNAMLNIELKGPNTAGAVAELLKRYGKGLSTRVIVSSFAHAELETFATLMPEVRRGLLFEDDAIPASQYAIHANLPNLQSAYERIKPYSLHLCTTSLNAERAEFAQSRGLVFCLWTIGEKPPETAPEWLPLLPSIPSGKNHVIITDYPSVLRRVLGA